MIIDSSLDVTAALPALKKAGVTGFLGYLDPLGKGSTKALTAARARAIAANGLLLGLVSEGWGDFAHGAISQATGYRDGVHAKLTVPELGGDSATTLVYFAVDCDANYGQIAVSVVPYFKALHLAYPGPIGVYGSGAVCENLLAQKLVSKCWLSASMGWTRSQAFAASRQWALRQHVPVTLCGMPCDTNEANGDWGGFVPFPEPSKPSVPLVS